MGSAIDIIMSNKKVAEVKADDIQTKDFDWKVCIKGRRTIDPMISITKRGGITFNAGFMRKEFPDPDNKPGFVQLFLASPKGTDGVKFVALLFTKDKKIKNTHSLFYTQGRDGAMITCKSVLDEAGIDYSKQNGKQEYAVVDHDDIGKVYMIRKE